MSTDAELMPICENCPLNDLKLGKVACAELRNKAAEVFYGRLVEPWEIDKILVDEGADVEAAKAASECLGKVYRSHCGTVAIDGMSEGYIVPKIRNNGGKTNG